MAISGKHNWGKNYMIAALPFIGLLGSLALLPLLVPTIWHRFEKAILSFWGIFGVIVIFGMFSVSEAAYHITDVLWKEYAPFVALLFALFTIAGGIKVNFNRPATPCYNAVLFLIASLFASFIGTTGASMLFIRPLLNLNKHRKYKVHTLIFFIIIVSNVAGCLTPLGDPPLFLGYLEGVPFTWPLLYLWQPVLFMIVSLLVIYYGLDTYFLKKEEIISPFKIKDQSLLEGKRNFIILALVIGVVAFIQKMPIKLFGHLWGVAITSNDVLFFGLIMGLGILSLVLTPKKIHQKQDFYFGPVLDVARIFLCIFITLIPLNHLLAQGPSGPFSGIFSLLSGVNPTRLYFWLTGFFSSFLDNAPTYLVFFKIAGGSVGELTTVKAPLLMAISLGSVFMGALTYIGNAPNFMVLSMAKQHKIAMPSFFGYALYACLILIPLFIVVSMIWL